MLREFGGLFLKIYRKNAGMIKLDFDAVGAGCGDSDKLDYWAEHLHHRFYPLGYFEHWMLLIGEDSRIFADVNGYIVFLANDIWEALCDIAFSRYSNWREIFNQSTGEVFDP